MDRNMQETQRTVQRRASESDIFTRKRPSRQSFIADDSYVADDIKAADANQVGDGCKVADDSEAVDRQQTTAGSRKSIAYF